MNRAEPPARETAKPAKIIKGHVINIYVYNYTLYISTSVYYIRYIYMHQQKMYMCVVRTVKQITISDAERTGRVIGEHARLKLSRREFVGRKFIGSKPHFAVVQLRHFLCKYGEREREREY